MTLSFLVLAVAAGPMSDSTWSKALTAGSRLPDTAAARAQGFVPLARGKVEDLSPFQGQHWLNRERIVETAGILDQPTFVMFIPIDGVMKPIGLAYSARIGSDQPAPERLGDVTTAWHLHQMCLGIPGERATLADGADDCRARGGEPTSHQIAMVHAWTATVNPEGRYAHDNIALPFLATRVPAPTAKEAAEPESNRRIRALGLALGETYGAQLPYARRSEIAGRHADAADSLEYHRASLRALLPAIRIERRDHPTTPGPAETKAVAEWGAIQTIYQRLAPTPAFRQVLDRQTAEALGTAAPAPDTTIIERRRRRWPSEK